MDLVTQKLLQCLLLNQKRGRMEPVRMFSKGRRPLRRNLDRAMAGYYGSSNTSLRSVSSIRRISWTCRRRRMPHRNIIAIKTRLAAINKCWRHAAFSKRKASGQRRMIVQDCFRFLSRYTYISRESPVSLTSSMISIMSITSSHIFPPRMKPSWFFSLINL
jgi:hypothetical protein